MGIRYEWKLPLYDEAKVNEIAKSYNLSENTAKILYSRNIINHDDILSYLVGEYDEGFDPFLMNDMGKAVDRINQAIENEEKILVYGDYDADGITSTLLMLETLSSLGANVSPYIPNRFNEGYGPNIEAFEKIIDSGVTLIITVDNGIAGVDEIQFAQDRLCDVILTDHHKIQETIPNAYAVIHPEHPKSNYPFGNLAGVGVAFKLAHALLGIYPDFLLDLVAIGTVADMVPMVSENRIFVKQGIKLINEDTRLGIKYILQKANHTAKVDEQTIGFVIAPRLNSIGRMTSAKEGLSLLSVEDEESAINLVEKVENYNIERKAITEKISKNAELKVNEKLNSSVNLICKEDYHEGVMGIVASNLVEKYKKPILIAKIEGDTIKGSARSYGNFNLYEAMSKISDKFIAFGGHHSAAGFSSKIEYIDTIEKKLSSIYDEYSITADEKIHKDVDLIVNFNDISYQLLNDLNGLKPYGNSFENVCLLSENVLVDKKEVFGSEKQYLKLHLTTGDNILEAISFKDNSEYKNIKEGDIIDIMFNLAVNNFSGRTRLQLQIIDLQNKELLFKDYRHISYDFNLLPKEELKVSKKYKDIKNNYFRYEDLDIIETYYETINLLQLPTNLKIIKKLVKLKPKSIKIMCKKEDALYNKYLIDKDKLVKLFNILFKYKSIGIGEKDTLVKIIRSLETNFDSFKIMIKILQELNLCAIINNSIVFNESYENIDLDLSPTYKTMKERFYIEKLFLEKDILELNDILKEMLSI